MMTTTSNEQLSKPVSLTQAPCSVSENNESSPEAFPCMKANKDAIAPEETSIKIKDAIIPEDPRLIKKPECDGLKESLKSPAELEPTKKMEGNQAPKSKQRGSKWEEFPVEKWRSAVYVNRAYFGQLCTDQNDFTVHYAEQIKLSGRRVSLIEVGCGTGEFIRDCADNFRVAVGVDFNPHFIAYCNHEIPKGKQDQQRYIHGDACKLEELMMKNFPKEQGLLWDDVRIVACVGNTIGIIPQELKETVYNQMLDLAGPQGILIMSYWNARWFGDAVQNFYHANPQLCGPFKGESIDLSTTTLTTQSGYCTHWTSVEEARQVMQRLGAEIVSIKDQGKGVLVAARRLPLENETQKFTPPPRTASGNWYVDESDSNEEDQDRD